VPEFYVRRQLYFTFFLSFYLERIVGSKPLIVSFFLSSILGFLCHSRHAPTTAYIEWAGVGMIQITIENWYPGRWILWCAGKGREV